MYQAFFAAMATVGLIFTLSNCKPKTAEVASVVKAAGDPTTPEARDIVFEVLGRSQDGNNPNATCADSGCHPIPNDTIRSWGAQAKALAECRAEHNGNSGALALKRLGCMTAGGPNGINRQNPSWRTNKMGFFRAGAHGQVDFFKGDFEKAYGANAQQQYERFQNSFGGLGTAMPPSTDDNPNRRPLSRANFDRLIAWILDGYPGLPQTEVEQGPLSCEDRTSPDLKAHIIRTHRDKTNWFWKAIDNYRTVSRPFFGCPRVQSYDPLVGPLSCFQKKTANGQDQFAEIGDYDAAQRGARCADFGCWKAPDNTWNMGRTLSQKFTVRILAELDYDTFYWMRVSPDGYWVGNGRGHMERLSNSGQHKHFKVPAAYDPTWSPDNTMFSYMGVQTSGDWGDESGSAIFCNRGLLTEENATVDNTNSRPTFKVDFTPAFCGRSSMGTYQHLGSSVSPNFRGTMVLRGPFAGDAGNRQEDGIGNSFSNSTMEIYRAAQVGQDFKVTEAGSFQFDTVQEGDWSISPSGLFTIGRQVKTVDLRRNLQVNYTLRPLFPGCLNNPEGCNYSNPNPKVPEDQTTKLCMIGGKANISFDERFATTHHYVSTAQETRAIQETQSEINRFNVDPDGSGGNAPREEELELTETWKLAGSSNIHVYDMLTNEKFRVTTMPKGMYAMFPSFRADGWLYFLVVDRRGGQAKNYIAVSDIAVHLMNRTPTPNSGSDDIVSEPDPAHPEIDYGDLDEDGPGGQQGGQGGTGSFTAENSLSVGIPDDDDAGVTQRILLNEVGESWKISNMQVKLKVSHTYQGDLRVRLVAPDEGQECLERLRSSANEADCGVLLHDRGDLHLAEGEEERSQGANDIDRTFGASVFASLRGKGIKGTWAIHVSDHAGQDVGTIDQLDLQFSYTSDGGEPPPEPEMVTRTYGIGDVSAAERRIRDRSTTTLEIDVPDNGQVLQVDGKVDILHTYVGDLEIRLEDPSGRTVLLRDNAGGRTSRNEQGEPRIKIAYDEIDFDNGAALRGKWKWHIKDTLRSDTGSVENIELTIRFRPN